MANPARPATLPQDVFVESYDETFPDMVLRSQMDAGPAKQRRRFTAAVRPLAVVVGLTRAQCDTFDVFYNVTLGGGAISFDWIHPRTQLTVTLRFIGGQPPHLKPEAGAQRWQAALNLEVMP